MKILLTILAIIAGIIVLLLITALFTKKHYGVVRSIIIDKPVNEVFNYVRHLKNQDHYSKWVMADPSMKKSFSGTDGTVGFVYAWDGNKEAGQGEQEIKNIAENENVDIEIRFIKPFEGIAQVTFNTKPVSPNQTKVIWSMNSAMKYPMNIMLLFMDMDKILGKDLETSLANLKTTLEG